MLRDILRMERGVIMITGDAKRITKILVDNWTGRGIVFLAEELPFTPEIPEMVYIGRPSEGFGGYLLVDVLKKGKMERKGIYEWINAVRDMAIVVLYERAYYLDSVLRHGISKFLDYLLAYKRETVGFELLTVYKFENGKIVDRKRYVRKR
ncbi:hypothetical protein [Pyrococcus yayanosii]|uniref:Uncharacterized protein n=1 Tax=Pyrococcus yayanosii (strain CH1 / JCM 16557) TaxID=529709 RepID=F8AFU0_PYRYC|nr:hypothetical protein [Pyrococcus yayanosii]AEH23841.1 hypothetical protein PYCH_01320 [Pyrococcus yayanosii CH1]